MRKHRYFRERTESALRQIKQFNLTKEREKLEEINAFVGHISRLIPLFPSIPPNYNGKVMRIHNLEDNSKPETYVFSSQIN